MPPRIPKAMKIMPQYLPAHKELVQITGAMEIASGAPTCTEDHRAGRWSLLATLFIVTPANLDMALSSSWPKSTEGRPVVRDRPGQFYLDVVDHRRNEEGGRMTADTEVLEVE